MGMFDTLHIRCPECGDVVEQQTKAGECRLADYTLENAPPAILAAMDGETFVCADGHRFVVRVEARASLVRDWGDDDELDAGKGAG